MKKTIAILLVLVIGMVGVWAAAADGNIASSDTALIELTTKINKNAMFGLTTTAFGTTDTAFTNFITFNSNTLDMIEYTTGDMSQYVEVDSNGGQIVGYLHGLSNYTTAIDLGIAVTKSFTSEANGYVVGIAASPSSATISAVNTSTNALGRLKDSAIRVKITDIPAYNAAPAYEDYEATITISVTTQS